MKLVLDTIKKLEPIPIQWDRYTSTHHGFYVVYGWIARSDGQRDFIMICMDETDKPEDVFYTTSSAKYSAEVCKLLYGAVYDHNECRKINELLSLSVNDT